MKILLKPFWNAEIAVLGGCLLEGLVNRKICRRTPICRASGQLLDKNDCSYEINTERDVYIANVIKLSPAARNRNPEPEEIARVKIIYYNKLIWLNHR